MGLLHPMHAKRLYVSNFPSEHQTIYSRWSVVDAASNFPRVLAPVTDPSCELVHTHSSNPNGLSR